MSDAAVPFFGDKETADIALTSGSILARCYQAGHCQFRRFFLPLSWTGEDFF